jgi:hypothetical protein
LSDGNDEFVVFANSTDTLTDEEEQKSLRNFFVDRRSLVFNMANELIKHSSERRLVHDLLQDVLRLQQRLAWQC